MKNIVNLGDRIGDGAILGYDSQFLKQGQKKKPAVMIRRQQRVPEESVHPCPPWFPHAFRLNRP